MTTNLGGPPAVTWVSLERDSPHACYATVLARRLLTAQCQPIERPPDEAGFIPELNEALTEAYRAVLANPELAVYLAAAQASLAAVLAAYAALLTGADLDDLLADTYTTMDRGCPPVS